MIKNFISFIADFFRENNNGSSSKRLSMLSTIFAGIVLCFFSFFKNQEIPTTALTLITTLIGATTATYSITRWKEDGKEKEKDST